MDIDYSNTANSSSDSDLDGLPKSSLEAMLRQERSRYLTCDYLYQDQSESDSPTCKGPLSALEDDRSKMVQWMYQVADFCKFNRETVEIAMSYFDRLLLSREAAEEAMASTDFFQLAAMTCFYTAAKINEPESFEPWMLAKMSRGLYTGDQVEKMELVVLKAIDWRMNPPTALAFVREFLEILPKTHLRENLRETVYDLCKYQTELCVRVYEFVPIRASTIAAGALMNALESVSVNSVTLECVESMMNQFLKAAGQTMEITNKMDVKSRLYQAVTEYSGIHTEASPNSSWTAKQVLSRQSSYGTSPCTVVQQVHSSAA